MTTEQPNPSRQLQIRLNELAAKTRLGAMLSDEVLLKITSGKINREDVRRLVRNAEDTGAVYTDVAWVSALVQTGIEKSVIVAAWNRKDEITREMKEDSRQSPSE